MKFKVVSCNVFKREMEVAAQASPHELHFEFIELGEHAKPRTLHAKLQAAVDDAAGFDAVLLGYGLCGRATDGLAARDVPLVLPRSHDCCGVLLGSRKRFEDLFAAMPSTPFSSVGFVEHGEYFFTDGEMMLGDSYAALVEQYGEDDAQYIYEAMHPKLDGVLQPIHFIATPEVPSAEAREICRAKAEAEGREFRDLDGSLRLLRMLLRGEWPSDEFLVVSPGRRIRMVGDWDRIVESEPSSQFAAPDQSPRV